MVLESWISHFSNFVVFSFSGFPDTVLFNSVLSSVEIVVIVIVNLSNTVYSSDFYTGSLNFATDEFWPFVFSDRWGNYMGLRVRHGNVLNRLLVTLDRLAGTSDGRLLGVSVSHYDTDADAAIPVSSINGVNVALPFAERRRTWQNQVPSVCTGSILEYKMALHSGVLFEEPDGRWSFRGRLRVRHA